MLDELSRRHRVRLVTTHPPGDDPAALTSRLPACERIDSVPYAMPKQGTMRFAGDVAGSWVSPYPADLWRWRIPAGRGPPPAHPGPGLRLCPSHLLPALPNPSDP